MSPQILVDVDVGLGDTAERLEDEHERTGAVRLDRLFARELGTSVGREVMHQRLVKAKLLLRGSELPLSQIARLTGFCDAAYLANVFRREFGITPGIWRKS